MITGALGLLEIFKREIATANEETDMGLPSL
jgi:hypothetical protein